MNNKCVTACDEFFKITFDLGCVGGNSFEFPLINTDTDIFLFYIHIYMRIHDCWSSKQLVQKGDIPRNSLNAILNISTQHPKLFFIVIVSTTKNYRCPTHIHIYIEFHRFQCTRQIGNKRPLVNFITIFHFYYFSFILFHLLQYAIRAVYHNSAVTVLLYQIFYINIVY